MRSNKSRQLAGPTKKRILITLGLILLVLTSFFGGYFSQYALRGEGEQVVSDVMHIMDQVGFVYDAEKDEYVKLDEDKIARLIAGNFLDGYSTYYSKEEYAEIQQKNAGTYVNFGINMTNENAKSEENGTNEIYSVIVNSPAYLAGLKGGDKVVGIKLNDQEKQDISNGKQLNEFFKNTKAGDVAEFYLDGVVEPITVEKKVYSRCYVTYEDSEVSSYFSPEYGQKMVTTDDAYDVIVEQSKRPEGQTDTDLPAPDFDKFGDDVAYVKLWAFEGDADLQMGAIIEYMVERGRTKLVLDLAGNGGGSMTILQSIASYLIYRDGKNNTKIAIATEKLDGNEEDGYLAEGYRQTDYIATGNKFNTAITKISVVADRSTASASECLIGAMMYYSDGIFTKNSLVVVGSENAQGQTEYRTYGKGIMQTTYKLSSGGALKLTTAKLLQPNKKCIHGVGISPLIDQNKAQNHDLAVTRAIQIVSAN